MTSQTTHLPPWTIEELAEDTLSPKEKAPALEHLRSCALCAAELEQSRSMLAALSALPRFDPSPSFTEAVMARVAVAAAEPARSRLRRWLPASRKGWAGLGVALLVPALPLFTLVAWLFSHPGVTAGSLFGAGRRWAVDSAWSGVVGAAEWLVQTPVFSWMVTTGSDLVGGATGLSVIGIMFLLGIPLSGLALVRLLRTPTGGITHAH
ncbi:MAG TPA: hypothetical protein VFQ39_14795 [Longimicrobium sp.]|nr:hypothetical protein [Longimicrobium sp.]